MSCAIGYSDVTHTVSNVTTLLDIVKIAFVKIAVAPQNFRETFGVT